MLKRFLKWEVTASLVLTLTLLVALNTAAQGPTPEEIEASVEAGLEWLVAQQQPDGSWGDWEKPAYTGLALVKLEERAFEIGLSPFDPEYEYSDSVIMGLDYLFASAVIVEISPQPAGDPDTNGNGIGVFWPGDGHCDYCTGIAMMAIAGSRDPGRVVTVPGSPVDGWSYMDVLQDAVDYMAFGQNDAGWE